MDQTQQAWKLLKFVLDPLESLQYICLIMMPSGVRTKSALKYPHPIVKDLHAVVTESQQIFPPSFVTFQQLNWKHPSCKLLRCNIHQPSVGAEFAILLQPFHMYADTAPLLQLLQICHFCGAYVHPQSKLSFNSFLCNFCGRSCPCVFKSDGLQLNHACFNGLNLLSNFIHLSGGSSRRICIVIEASQQIYELDIHRQIIACIDSLSDNCEIGFIFYNVQTLCFLDQSSKQLVTVHQSWLQTCLELPLPLCDLFRDSKSISQDIKLIIEQLMYQSLLVRNTLIGKVCCFLARTVNHVQADIKWFLTTLDTSEPVKSELADRSNVFNIFKPRILPTGFVLGSNVDCFVILRNASYSQAMSLLHASVRQIYDPKSPSLLDDVYYDLYESITEDVWYEIEVVIKTTPELCVRQAGNRYGNQIWADKGSHGQTRIRVKKATRNYVLPVVFSISNKYRQDDCQPAVQFVLRYLDLNDPLQKSRVLTWYPNKILPTGKLSEDIDDQSYFYVLDRLFKFMLRRVFQRCEDDVAKRQNREIARVSIKQRLKEELRHLAEGLGWEAKSSGIDCSRKFKLTILYCYLVDKRAALDSDNPQLPYEKCKMLTSPLQVLSKMLYPRVYTLQDTLSLKNIKFQAKKFGTASITLLDNGRRLFMLVGEDTPQNILQKLVGYSNSQQRYNLHELPMLASNERWRAAIDWIRDSNESSYLPLRIVDLFSAEADRQMLNSYKEDEHKTYLWKLWKHNDW